MTLCYYNREIKVYGYRFVIIFTMLVYLLLQTIDFVFIVLCFRHGFLLSFKKQGLLWKDVFNTWSW